VLRGRVSVPKALKTPPARAMKRFQALRRAHALLQEASHRWGALWWALGGAGTRRPDRHAAALRQHQRRSFDTGTTVTPSWRAASASRSSNTTKGSGWLISRCR